jgi:glutamate synthase domain-containing protein 3
MSLIDIQKENEMHQLLLDELLTDAICYTEHNAAASILDKWTKEQMAFGLNEMVTRLRCLRDEHMQKIRNKVRNDSKAG